MVHPSYIKSLIKLVIDTDSREIQLACFNVLEGLTGEERPTVILLCRLAAADLARRNYEGRETALWQLADELQEEALRLMSFGESPTNEELTNLAMRIQNARDFLRHAGIEWN